MQCSLWLMHHVDSQKNTKLTGMVPNVETTVWGSSQGACTKQTLGPSAHPMPE
jgi:hypothetical protein